MAALSSCKNAHAKASTCCRAVAYGNLKNGVDVCKFGKQWVVSAEAVQREYSEHREKLMIISFLSLSNIPYKV